MAAPTEAVNGSAADAPKKAPVAKPEKPDEEQYKKDLAQAEKEHAEAMSKFNAVKSKLDLTRPSNKDSPAGKRQQELRAELSSIRQQQSGFKTGRTSTMEKIKKLDEVLKAKVAEQKAARGQHNFQSVEEISAKILELQKQVAIGSLKLVDERRANDTIGQLQRQKKAFGGLEQQEKNIQDIKAQIADLRKSLDDPEAKAISDRYTAIAKELDGLKAESDAAFKNINALRDERTKANAEQQEKYTALREVKNKYYNSLRAFKDYEFEAKKQRFEKQKQEREKYETERRKATAQQKLEEASAPAYQNEIHIAQGLIRYFDPTSVEAKEATGPSKFAAAPQRTVDSSGMKGTVLKSKKDVEDDYFVGTGGKKGKKGAKKGGPATPTESSAPASGKFNMSIGIIEELGKIGLDAPGTQGDVPAVLQQLRDKLEFWRKDQDRKTKENIQKAKNEIERLEAAGPSKEEGAMDKGTKVAQKNAGINGKADAEKELQQEEDAVKDVAEEMEAAKIEDADGA
ncbi:hypothetical protein K402DRAFT_379250 [Aulographum hederae CBS 113979]|uniref:Nuclear segregation protein n=1 Tax=Aulographum hederae CBS 113979 TaxID=1176131 RepID=A0A6G1GXD0_9PEZI|nr:hypothetical protein K402DRAFT_379250 [Aulographum hederae CBS 113979]